nr:RagB/SusD family nutrient uptake outer membrane protein [Mucilaginibacter sp. L294]
MKKKFQAILFSALCALLFFSCKNDLNVAPQNIIQDETVFSNESAITAYFASMYNDLPIEDFNFHSYAGFNTNSQSPLSDITDEAMNCLNDDRLDIGNGVSLGWWSYGPVRNVNIFLQKIGAAPFPEEKKNGWLGEAKFIRAYYYWGMVKRYGGVPLITDVQSFTGNNLEELKVPRNTEKEVYDFIAKELDEAIALLPETSDGTRANKYAAYALKSRAMLYAASEATYGSVQLNGLIGIPSSNSAAYWQAAYDAANKVITSGKYLLYNKDANKAVNYTNAFLDVTSTENIFVKKFQYPDKTHSYDLWVLPRNGVGPSIGYGSRVNPTLELVESYEYTDGTDGKLKLKDGAGNPIPYTNPTDVFLNKDPRLDATILLPFADWKGYKMDVRAGLIDNGKLITAGNYNDLYNNIHIIGLNGIGGGGEVSQTGFYVRKYLQPAYDKALVVNNSSFQQYIDLRYAEVLLNYAEAAIELGKTADAKVAINLIRDRAGIKALTDAEVTRDKVRHERQIELALEPHRYWDIRRWRLADKLLNNTRFTAIMPYRVLPGNTYQYNTKLVGNPKTFTPNMYYERIDPGEISKNPKLIQNPGY